MIDTESCQKPLLIELFDQIADRIRIIGHSSVTFSMRTSFRNFGALVSNGGAMITAIEKAQNEGKKQSQECMNLP